MKIVERLWSSLLTIPVIVLLCLVGVVALLATTVEALFKYIERKYNVLIR